MQPLRNVLVQNAARAVNDDVITDLPVNPLYCILYTIRAQQLAASTTTDKIVGLLDLCNAVSKIEVLFRGSTVLSGNLQDIAVMNAILSGRYPYIIHQGDALNRDVAVTVPIYLGRPTRKGMEAFPATRKGELSLHRTMNSAFTNLNATTLTEQIETVELLGADPKQFLKYVTLSKTFVTTGDNDVDLPLGNPIAHVLVWGNTPWTAAASVATWKQTKLLVDNVEYWYALTNWESLHGELNISVPLSSELQDHTHTENLAAAYAADAASAKPRTAEGLLANYGLLDFDPWDDDAYLVQTAGRGRVHMRVTAGSADAARALPLELISITPTGGTA
jgi:hypothetical protein